MISIGVQLNGPELSKSTIKLLLMATMRAIADERGPIVGDDDFGPCDPRPVSGSYFEIGSAPALNVVFHVQGSFNVPMPEKIEAARFSRKQKELLVAVPVTKEEVKRGGLVEFVIGALHEANRIAAETFGRKGTEPFDRERADAIVEKVRQSLVEQGF